MSSVYGLPKAFIKKKFWQQQLNSFSCSKFQNVLNCQNLTKCAKCNGTMTTIKQKCKVYPRSPTNNHFWSSQTLQSNFI